MHQFVRTPTLTFYEEYHPYGTSSYRAVNAGIATSAKRYRYTGKERDEESGLYYHGARYYACWLGRWTASDPIGLGDAVNRFAYVSGNPVVLSDPTGTDGVLNDLIAQQGALTAAIANTPSDSQEELLAELAGVGSDIAAYLEDGGQGPVAMGRAGGGTATLAGPGTSQRGLNAWVDGETAALEGLPWAGGKAKAAYGAVASGLSGFRTRTVGAAGQAGAALGLENLEGYVAVATAPLEGMAIAARTGGEIAVGTGTGPAMVDEGLQETGAALDRGDGYGVADGLAKAAGGAGDITLSVVGVPAALRGLKRFFGRLKKAPPPSVSTAGGGTAAPAAGGGARKTLTAKDVTKGMEIDPTEVSVFRGGSSFEVRPMDIKIDKTTGMVKPTHGMSLDVDAAAMERFGGAHRIESIPSELRIMQRGKKLGHFEIMPREAMTPERFQELVGQIKFSKGGG